MDIFKDVICITILIFVPDFFLERLGLYKSMETIITERKNR